MLASYKADSSFERVVVVMAGKRKRDAKARRIQLHRLLEEASDAISLKRLFSLLAGSFTCAGRAFFLQQLDDGVPIPANSSAADCDDFAELELWTDTKYKMIVSHIVQCKAAVQVAPDAAAAANTVTAMDAVAGATAGNTSLDVALEASSWEPMIVEVHLPLQV